MVLGVILPFTDDSVDGECTCIYIYTLWWECGTSFSRRSYSSVTQLLDGECVCVQVERYAAYFSKLQWFPNALMLWPECMLYLLQICTQNWYRWLYVYVCTHVLVFGEAGQSHEAMSHGHGWHPGMEGYWHDEVADHRQPPDARVHVLAEETANSLRWRERGMQGNE